MSFGLSNALNIFIRVMTQILCPYLSKFVVFYFDDILVCNRIQEEHLLYLTQNFETLSGEDIC